MRLILLRTAGVLFDIVLDPPTRTDQRIGDDSRCNKFISREASANATDHSWIYVYISSAGLKMQQRLSD